MLTDTTRDAVAVSTSYLAAGFTLAMTVCLLVLLVLTHRPARVYTCTSAPEWQTGPGVLHPWQERRTFSSDVPCEELKR